MEVDSSKMYLQNLEEFVFDEGKIITYKWLSNNLSLHINFAKQLLELFCKEQEKKRPNVKFCKSFYVSGISKEKTGLICSIVNEENLTTFKQSLCTILSEHIYSISKGESPVDSTALSLVEEHDDSIKGVIKNDLIIKRTTSELSSFRLGTYPKSSEKNIKLEPKKEVSGQSTSVTNHASAVKKEIEDKCVHRVSEKSTASSSNEKPKKSTGIAGFFSKTIANTKSSVVKSEPVKLNKSMEKENLHQKVNSVISNLVKEEPTVKKPPMDVENNNSSKSTSTVVKEPLKKPDSKKRETKISKKEPTKKRKRIQAIESDSDEEDKSDDDIFAPNSPEMPAPALVSDDEDVIPPTPEVLPKSNKISLNSRKRKKIVDKTYMDEKGYIITKKEEVYESCSDEDVEIKPAKTSPLKNVVKNEIQPTNNSKKKPNSPSKGKKKTSPQQGQGKQQSLMNFFKKEAK